MCYMDYAIALPRIGVRELRQNLSVYLARIKRGETLMVTEHGVVVAELKPVAPPAGWLDRLVQTGGAVAPARPAADRPAPLSLRLDTPLSVLVDEERSDRL
jgi:antitoxin (DNA-binding transcriptional repressor) of toxin-antitoxin stability system